MSASTSRSSNTNATIATSSETTYSGSSSTVVLPFKDKPFFENSQLGGGEGVPLSFRVLQLNVEKKGKRFFGRSVFEKN